MPGLNPWNIFFLCASAYLGDISQVADDQERPVSNSSNEECKNSIAHGRRSAIIIRERWQMLGFADPDQARIVAGICLEAAGM